MATIAAKRLLLDLEQRDLIVKQIQRYEHVAPDDALDRAVQSGDRDEVMEIRARLDWVCSILGELGWEEHGLLDSYMVTVDEHLVQRMQQWREDTVEETAAEAGHFDLAICGDEGWYPVGHTQAQAIAWYDQLLAGYRRELAVLDGLTLAVA